MKPGRLVHKGPPVWPDLPVRKDPWAQPGRLVHKGLQGKQGQLVRKALQA